MIIYSLQRKTIFFEKETKISTKLSIILMERVAVEELLLQEHISVPAAYERVREYVDRFEKESKLKNSNDY